MNSPDFIKRVQAYLNAKGLPLETVSRMRASDYYQTAAKQCRKGASDLVLGRLLNAAIEDTKGE